MAFEGFLTRILKFTMGLKPQYTLLWPAGPRIKVLKIEFEGSLLVFYNCDGLKPQHPLLWLAEPEDPRCINGI
ncbi:Hypothetical protein FKW44_012438 [Caligus rogercresseyi]|uniref:Uncharacterized protein n=1 Tax=Caligus rogercresseyi TaxID=217165 RepID=A0A7T8KAV9_CALRO|nr:Hypothetical protein FKW44_012438 [Caligus rogercresseyi]